MVIELSTNVKSRHLKLLFWGDTGTRKTESALRYFPHILLIDTEGNSDQCIGVDEIPPFLRVVTKDFNEILRTIDDVTAGKIKFPDGSPIETLVIDSTSVLWNVSTEITAISAEKRAAKYNRSAEDATTTQLDWVIGKRPMKRLYARAAASPIKFLIFTAREADKYDEASGRGDGNSLKKVGVKPDTMKGLEYDVNLALHMTKTDGKWSARVSKVQGALGKILPDGSRMNEFPAQKILDYARNLTGNIATDEDEQKIANAAYEHEEQMIAPKTQSDLLAFARQYSIEPKQVGEILKAKGYNEFRSSEYKQYTDAIVSFVAESM